MATDPTTTPGTEAGTAEQAGDGPWILVQVCVNDADETSRDTVSAGLVDAGMRRVHAEAREECASYVIAWHEGRDLEFAQAALVDGRRFRVEIHDASTPEGCCLALDDVELEAAIGVLRTWIAGGAADPSLDWAMESWEVG